MTRGAALVLTLAVAAAGCGGAESARPTAAPQKATTTSPEKPKIELRCKPTRAPGYRACERFLGERRQSATLELRIAPGRWRVVARQPKGARVDRVVHGYWPDAWLSPDGRALLAQWSGECEIPTAFFVPARGGPMRPVTGERDWRKSPESVALGWMADGRARVRLLGGLCGHAGDPPGIYAIDPRTGEATLLRELPAHP